MADITTRQQGEVSDEAKQNWRGDQAVAPQGGQSIYKTSTIQLAQLGSRKVVGDRVFRYSKTKVALSPGHTMQYGGESLTSLVTSQGAGVRTATMTAATAVAKDTYAEGYLLCEIGATDSNAGMVFRIKSNALGSSAGTCVLTLYDPIPYAVQATSTWTVSQNLYLNADTAAADGCALGVSPVHATTNDYFWLQTWGPASIAGTVAVGSGMMNSVSGLATVMDGTGQAIGAAIQALAAATNQTLMFLTVAP